MQVFLSYHKSDSSFAKELTKHLQKQGFTVWDRLAQILPGENWSNEVSKALKSSRAMIVLLSPDSVRSEWQQREIEYALGDQNYAGRLFPIQVRPMDSDAIPWILRKLNILDARDGAEKVGSSIAQAAKTQTHSS
jgi:hypothetical protein